MTKADEKPKYENDDGKEVPEAYTNFEYLEKKVEVLQEQIEVIGKILRSNGMTKIEEEYDMAPDFEDETCKKLEEED